MHGYYVLARVFLLLSIFAETMTIEINSKSQQLLIKSYTCNNQMKVFSIYRKFIISFVGMGENRFEILFRIFRIERELNVTMKYFFLIFYILATFLCGSCISKQMHRWYRVLVLVFTFLIYDLGMSDVFLYTNFLDRNHSLKTFNI